MFYTLPIIFTRVLSLDEEKKDSGDQGTFAAKQIQFG